jgi:hypothetical protein
MDYGGGDGPGYYYNGGEDDASSRQDSSEFFPKEDKQYELFRSPDERYLVVPRESGAMLHVVKGESFDTAFRHAHESSNNFISHFDLYSMSNDSYYRNQYVADFSVSSHAQTGESEITARLNFEGYSLNRCDHCTNEALVIVENLAENTITLKSDGISTTFEKFVTSGSFKEFGSEFEIPAIANPGSAKFGDRLLVWGHDTVETRLVTGVFDFSKDTWKETENVDQPRYEKYYTVAGCDDHLFMMTEKGAWTVDPATMVDTSIENIGELRSGFKVNVDSVCVGQDVYVFSSAENENQLIVSNDFYRFDRETKKLIALGVDDQTPMGKLVTMDGNKDFIVLWDGKRGTVYNIASKKWRSLEVPTNWKAAINDAFLFDGRLLVIPTHTEIEDEETALPFNLKLSSWSMEVVPWELTPWLTRGTQGQWTAAGGDNDGSLKFVHMATGRKINVPKGGDGSRFGARPVLDWDDQQLFVFGGCRDYSDSDPRECSEWSKSAYTLQTYIVPNLPPVP